MNIQKMKYLLFFILPLFTTLTFADPNCNCPGCNLINSNFENYQPGKDTNASNMCTQTCNLDKANLSNANFSNTNLTVCISGYQSMLGQSHFVEANLSQANFKNSTLIGNNFEKANLSQANLSNSNLSLASFKKANFTSANLSNSHADCSNMSGAGTNFNWADFSNANLSGAKLCGSFMGANFKNANLMNAVISTSPDASDPKHPASGAELWKKVDFTNANLKGAKLLDTSIPNQEPNLSKAIFCHTVMPDGSVNNAGCKQ